MTREHVLKLRRIIETFSASMSDKEASECVEFAPKYPYDGSLIRTGIRYRWGDELYVSRVDLWATEQNDLYNAPTLWEKVMYRDGIRIIPEYITATNPFSRGERGWWTDNRLYESQVDGNVYTPAQYAPNWKEVTK